MKNRIVLDTSIIISALIGERGPSRRLLHRCLQGDYVPLISNALFLEYEAVSNRGVIQEQCPLTQEEIRELLNAFYGVCQWVSIYYLWRPNLPDEGDNFLIELAIAGNAFCVVTNNLRDLQASELIFPDLKILKPEHLLERR
jgi:putative PIN family toxin of toxin-antitoxin system